MMGIYRKIGSILILWGLTSWAFAETPCELFSSQTLDDAIPGAYQTALADINGDGQLDIAALGEGNSGVYWYENPSWKRHPICVEELTGFIDLAFYDLDGDGELEIALASDFNLGQTQSGGTLSWLDRKPDLNQPWTVYPIHREPTIHRLRWAHTNGNASPPRLIVAPIAGVGSSGPRFQQSPVRLLAFTIPPNPQKDAWPLEVIDSSLHLLHGLSVYPRAGKDILFTASLEGLNGFERDQDRWLKHPISEGANEPEKLTGSSEIALGTWKNGEHFLASIDPWHGHQVSVYSPFSFAAKQSLQRSVIDDSFQVGHAVAAADFDGDGEDEIIAGYRGEGCTIYYYDFVRASTDSSVSQWKRFVIDQGGVAAQGFAIGDLNADGRLDFVATGGSTHNVKLFLNRGMKTN